MIKTKKFMIEMSVSFNRDGFASVYVISTFIILSMFFF